MISIRKNKFAFLLMRMVTITLVFLVTTVLGGCRGKTQSGTSAEQTSVMKLLKRLDNFKTFNIESCSFHIKKTYAPSGMLPSPSETSLELSGWIVLSEKDAKMLKSSFDWEPIARQNIPEALLAKVPPGDVLVSQKLNGSFASNGTYANGLIIVLVSDGWKKIYFLATG